MGQGARRLWARAVRVGRVAWGAVAGAWGAVRVALGSGAGAVAPLAGPIALACEWGVFPSAAYPNAYPGVYPYACLGYTPRMGLRVWNTGIDRVRVGIYTGYYRMLSGMVYLVMDINRLNRVATGMGVVL